MAETTTSRPLTINEANKPILDIQGEQALMGADTIDSQGDSVAGSYDLGKAEYTPVDQSVQTDEDLTVGTKALTPTSVSGTTTTSATPTAVAAPTTATPSLIDLDSVERTFTSLPTIAAQQGTLSTGAIIDPNQVVDERTKAEMTERGSLAEAKTQTLAQEATTQYQIAQMMTSLDNDQELPAWAAPNVRKVKSIMNQRGLGASSMASAAMVQALMESAIPIANADAQAYSRIQLQNLTNEQQTALSNAATIAAMDRQNLDNRMKAAQQNATTFLQMDITNLNNRQATETLNYQTKVQSLFTDQAATVSTNNANREASMNTFNADQSNAMKKYNAKLEDTREQFNSNMQLMIDQSNVVWRRTLNTANTAEQNKANQINAQTVLGLSVQAQNNLWQKYRDEVSMAFNASQNDMQRGHAIAITAISNQFTSDMFEAQIEYEAAQASSEALSGLITKAFDIGKAVLSNTGSSSSGGGSTNYTDFFQFGSQPVIDVPFT